MIDYFYKVAKKYEVEIKVVRERAHDLYKKIDDKGADLCARLIFRL